MVKMENFYDEDGVVASTDPGWLQSAFDFLTGLFDRVGLRTNIRKTVVFQTFVCSPTQSSSPVSKSNSDWSHPGSVEATTL